MYGAMKKEQFSNASNDAKIDIELTQPYVVEARLVGVCSLLFHRYSVEAVTIKGAAAKNSAAKKTDNVESYVYRTVDGELAIPGENVRQSILLASKSIQDPRSPRKSALDLFKAGVVAMTDLCTLGVKDWDFLDTRRAVVQRNAINRTRPGMNAGWVITCQLQVLTPEYISPDMLHDRLTAAGRLCGLCDFRPTFGRFRVDRFEVLDLNAVQAAE